MPGITVKHIKDTGDTIVEVLVSTAVVSLLLGGAFNLARDSLFTIQRSHERSEATKLLETQAERLKAASRRTEASTSGVFSGGIPAQFCINNTLAITSGTCALGLDNRYQVAISRSVDQRTFLITITWDGLGGGSEEMNSAYRLYP